jgi:hypothetical protein
MSFRRPKASYKRRRVVQSSAPLASTPLVVDDSPSGSTTQVMSVSDAPQQKRPRHSKDLFLPGPEGLITLPGGLTLTQATVTDAFNDRVRDSEGQRRRSSSNTSDDDTNYANANHIGSLNNLNSTTMGGNEPRRQRRQRKKARASAKWITDIIPSLIPIYLRLYRETESFRLNPTNPVSKSTPCSCTSSRPLTVACLFFQRKPVLNIVFLLCF